MTDSHSQPSNAIDPAKLWEQYLAETDFPSAQGAMAFAADIYASRIEHLEARVAILDFCCSRVDCLVRGEAMDQKEGSKP